jgi:uncharacterized protein YhaN
MWIRNFDLDDFGCFQRARLGALDDGLTVISGPQRAGKTTFMRAMRKLGYGISTGEDLPPPTDEYELAAEVVHRGTDCDISVSGYADPRLISADGTLAPEDLFGSVGAAAYRQLFTISLDQLRRMPAGIADRAELSAILLGAGYGDIAQIPEIRDELAGNASDIGGKHGRAVYEMGTPVDTIEAGLDDRADAREHVDQHRATRDELADVERRIEDVEEDRARLARQQTRLAAIEAVYEDFERYRRLEDRLAESDRARVERFPLDALAEARRLDRRYTEAKEGLEGAEAALSDASDVDEIDAHRAQLLAIEDTIERYDRQISGWRQRREDLEDRAAALAADREALAADAGALNDAWAEKPDAALGISLDALTADAVRTVTSEFRTARGQLSEAQADLADEQAARAETAEKLAEATEDGTDGAVIREVVGRVAALSTAGILLGGAVGVAVAASVGLLIMGLVVGVAILYAYFRLLRGELRVADSSVSQLRMERNRQDGEIRSLDSRIERATERRDSAEADLEELRERLGLPPAISAEGVESYYEKLETLQKGLREAARKADRIAEDRAALRAELETVHDTVGEVREPDIDESALLETAEELFEAIRVAAVELEMAKELETARTAVADREAEILETLSAWERLDAVDAPEDLERPLEMLLEEFLDEGETVETLAEDVDSHATLASRIRSKFGRRTVREALGPICRSLADDADAVAAAPEEIDADRIIGAAAYVADGHVDADAIAEQLDTVDAKMDENASDRKALVDERSRLESELEELSSDEDIVAAQERIERGRQRLRPLAERYAENRIAETLVERLHERFIEKATGPLLADASTLFERITDEYTAVGQVGSLDDLKFHVQRGDGSTQGSAELSRATAEQLFLAVRIARIQQLDVSLPVVYDDSMTNFDPAHLGRTLDLLGELAETNQVFFLTCHPEFVEKTAERTDVDQFWSLEDGRFDGPYDEPAPVMAALEGD